MWLQFFLENAQFAVGFFTAFVFFAIFWLYWDAWRATPRRRDFFRLIGFLLLAVSFVFEASRIETVLLPGDFGSSVLMGSLLIGTRILGYFFVLLGMILDPLPQHPHIAQGTVVSGVAAAGLPFPFLIFLFPLGAASVAFMFLKRATLGLERHMRNAAIGFFLLSVAHVFGLAAAFRGGNDSVVFALVAPFGLFWIMEKLFIAAGAFFLGKWVWEYLLTRVKTQLFMVFTCAALVIFLVTVTIFTGLLISNMRSAVLEQLASNNKVMTLALESKRQEISAYAKTLAENGQLVASLKGRDQKTLDNLTEKNLLNWELDSLVVTDADGKVVTRGENAARVGDSLSDNSLVHNALSGKEQNSYIVTEGALAPAVFAQAVQPIKNGTQIVGTVLVGFTIDNAFLDGVKKATGLETAVYGDNILSASTIVASDGKSRWVGVKENAVNIKENVLKKGESVLLTRRVQNTPYLASFAPLRDVDGKTVGMIFVGKPEITIVIAAGRSLSLTFVLTGLLIVLSIVPSYLLARHFAYQLR